MTPLRLLLNSLAYFWRGNSAVMLGVAVGCAVLTGALLVGDSLQGSLRARSERRLGWVTHAVTAPRFFREALAAKVAEKAEGRVVPALLLQASVSTGADDERRQVRAVTVLGVDESFLGTPVEPSASSALARALRVKEGDTVTVHLQKPGALPREAALGKKEAEIVPWPVQLARVLTDADAADAFNLRPELEAPRSLFVPLAELQAKLGLGKEVNALLAAGDGTKLQEALEAELDLEDWGLVLRTPAGRAADLVRRYDRNRNGKLDPREWRKGGKPVFAHVLAEGLKGETLEAKAIAASFTARFPYIALESRQMLLPAPVAAAAESAALGARMPMAPTLVYLCKIEVAGKEIAGVVAAAPAMAAPLGPFLPPGKAALAKDEIVLAHPGLWPEKARPAAGSKVVLRYKPPESHGPAADRVSEFKLAGFVARGDVTADPGLTPEFPGITDKDTAGEWDLPFDDPKWQRDVMRRLYTDEYWDEYRAAPRAYVSLEAGQELWASRFGALTSIRFDPGRGVNIEEAAARLRQLLRANLKAADGGFVFDPVLASALTASQGGTPFGLLFLGFSFFLIIAALLLVGLLYRLNIDRRASQVGLLLAQGFPLSAVRWLYLGEGGLLALLGVLLGSFLALFYSRALIQLLAFLWPGGVLRSFLTPHASPMSFVWGIGGALLVSVLTVAWVVRVLGQAPPRALLAGQTADDLAEADTGIGWWTWGTLTVSLMGGVGLLFLAPTMKGHEAQAGSFFGSGALFLTAGLTLVHAWMRGTRQGAISGKGWLGVARLGLRNAARNPLRSMLTVGLLASAAFLIAAVESFRREAKAGDGTPNAPDGGFALVGESDLPVVRDLQSAPGRAEIIKGLERRLGKQPAPERDKRLVEAEELLRQTTIIGLRVRSGDDASCLNLYKPRTPRVLGVPAALIERGGFVFDAVKGDYRDRPWQWLKGDSGELAPGATIPAFGESNTVTWMLQKGMGGVIEVTDDRSRTAKLEIAGLMHDSVFQSALLIGEADFLRLFPSEEGYRSFLIAPPAGREEDVRRLLEQGLSDVGLEVSFTKEKLASYLAVENTYLTTFQALGGLGLILGSLGVGVVLLRSVWERRSELALLRALGWRNAQVAWLVLAENLFLLLLGLAVGAVAAVLSVSPRLAGGQATIPWMNLGLLFGGVLAVGLVACLLAVVGTLRAPIVPALRRE